jgi:CDK-activating kinase assembly factor MAT1
VDTRRRLNRIYNKTEEDFEDLRSYNDYLEQVEMITFNLTQGIDVAETEAKVKAYQYANKQSIASNTSREKAEAALVLETARLEQEAKAEVAREAQMLLEQEMTEERESHQEVLSAMAAGADVDAIVKETKENAQRRLEARRHEANMRIAQKKAQLEHLRNSKGRLQQIKQQDKTPFSPLMGMGEATQLYDVQDDYEDASLAALKRDKTLSGGGARVQDIYERALFEAFAGLLLPEDVMAT